MTVDQELVRENITSLIEALSEDQETFYVALELAYQLQDELNNQFDILAD
jgi:hypothetical protein